MSNVASKKKELLPKQGRQLLGALKARFEQNLDRHQGLEWAEVQTRLEASPGKLWSLNEMERTGGEPDVVGHDKKTGEYVFHDCSAETPKGRRNLCYDREALIARKTFKPENSALDMAAVMGVELLSEEQYRELQKLGDFDTKTSSWLKTPPAIRKLGGALFADRRYDHVFVYHNGASSYFGGRGFRASLRVQKNQELGARIQELGGASSIFVMAGNHESLKAPKAGLQAIRLEIHREAASGLEANM